MHLQVEVGSASLASLFFCNARTALSSLAWRHRFFFPHVHEACTVIFLTRAEPCHENTATRPGDGTSGTAASIPRPEAAKDRSDLAAGPVASKVRTGKRGYRPSSVARGGEAPKKI